MYSDGSGDPVEMSPGQSNGLGFSDKWLPHDRMDDSSRYAFAYVLPPAVNPSPIIWAAFEFELLPSSRGTMLLCFPTTDA